MKKALVIGALVLGIGVSGVLGTVWEFATVASNYVTSVGKKAIPVAIDIERLELAINQLDSEIAKNGRSVVEEAVALDQYQAEVDEKARNVARLKSDLSELRDRYTSVSCEASRCNLEAAIGKRLARAKAQTESLVSMHNAAENRRLGYEKMVAAFEQQKLDRDLLREKLEAFRAEHATMKMRGELEHSTFATSASRKATDLAIEIGDRLEVNRRLAKQLSNEIDLGLADESPKAGFDISELDEVLGTQSRLAANE